MIGAFGNMTGSDIMAAWTLISLLCTNEGSSVEICSPNGSFEGPGYAIEVADEWTGWEMKRFEGDTIVDALDAANRERLAHQ